jgi:hypothetical protein
MTAAVDAVLATFERETTALAPDDDDAVWSSVEHVVVALNAIDEDADLIETDELTDTWRDW